MLTYMNYVFHAISRDICDPIIAMKAMKGSIHINHKRKRIQAFVFIICVIMKLRGNPSFHDGENVLTKMTVEKQSLWVFNV